MADCFVFSNFLSFAKISKLSDCLEISYCVSSSIVTCVGAPIRWKYYIHKLTSSMNHIASSHWSCCWLTELVWLEIACSASCWHRWDYFGDGVCSPRYIIDIGLVYLCVGRNPSTHHHSHAIIIWHYVFSSKILIIAIIIVRILLSRWMNKIVVYRLLFRYHHKIDITMFIM